MTCVCYLSNVVRFGVRMCLKLWPDIVIANFIAILLLILRI